MRVHLLGIEPGTHCLMAFWFIRYVTVCDAGYMSGLTPSQQQQLLFTAEEEHICRAEMHFEVEVADPAEVVINTTVFYKHDTDNTQIHLLLVSVQ